MSAEPSLFDEANGAPASPSSSYYDRTPIPAGVLIKKTLCRRSADDKQAAAGKRTRSVPNGLEADGVMNARGRPLGSDASSDAEFEVEAILGVKRVGKFNLYLVKWKGFDQTHNTWEPTAHLGTCQSLVRAFNRQKRLSETVAETQDEDSAAVDDDIDDDDDDDDEDDDNDGRKRPAAAATSSATASSSSSSTTTTTTTTTTTDRDDSAAAAVDGGGSVEPLDLEDELRLLISGGKSPNIGQLHGLVRRLVAARAIAAAVFVFDRLKQAYPSINTTSSPETFQLLEPLHDKELKDSGVGHALLTAEGYLPMATTPERRLHKIVKGYHVSRDYGPAVDKYAARTYEVLLKTEGVSTLNRFELARLLTEQIDGMTSKQAGYLVTHLKRKKLWEETRTKRDRSADGSAASTKRSRSGDDSSSSSTITPSPFALFSRDSIPSGILLRNSKVKQSRHHQQPAPPPPPPSQPISVPTPAPVAPAQPDVSIPISTPGTS